MAQPVTSLPPWQSAGIEPKRKYKYILNLGDIPAWVIKTSGRPNVNISEGAKHNFMAYEFKYPGKVTWDNVEITLVDPIDPDVASIMFKIIQDAGYRIPRDWTAENAGWKISMSKLNSINATKGDIAIKTVDSNGNDVEKFTLRNAWVKSINYDDVSYDSEELMSISVTLAYDYAVHELFDNE